METTAKLLLALLYPVRVAAWASQPPLAAVAANVLCLPDGADPETAR
jgi:hypothetical protein